MWAIEVDWVDDVGGWIVSQEPGYDDALGLCSRVGVEGKQKNNKSTEARAEWKWK